jgi:hypothetical protein
MPLIEAFLALALTMLSLAMIATLAVEFFHRITGTRAKDLEGMLEKFYDSELKSVVEAELLPGLKSSDEKLATHRRKFVKSMVDNPLLVKESPGLGERIRARLNRFDVISTEDFFKQLAYTDIGRRIKAKAEEEIDDFVDSLSRAYDRFGEAATDLFKRRARLISLVAGILVAFGMNVNGLSLFQSYMNDPHLRASVVSRADEIAAAFEDKQGDREIEGFRNKEDFDEYLGSFKEEVGSLAGVGVDFGYSWDLAPGRLWRSDEGEEAESFPKWRGTLFWLLGVLGTGLLIGLGGPFWFDVVRKLTAVTQGIRGGVPTGSASAGETAGPAADPIGSFKETFKKIGGTPLLIRAQARLAAAARAAIDADNVVRSAAAALQGTQDVLERDPDKLEKVAAVVAAEEAFEAAVAMKKKGDEARAAAERKAAAAESDGAAVEDRKG